MPFAHNPARTLGLAMRTILSASLLILAATCAPGIVHATTFTVDETSTDLGDLNPGDGKCEWSTSVPIGQRCTLRAAIQETNALAGPDVIIIPFNANIVLSRAGRNEDAGNTGDLDITDSLTITTPAGSSRELWPAIDANSIDRVFDVRASAINVTFHNLVIRNGKADDATTFAGGGIRADYAVAGATLTIAACELVSNVANFGAGIYTARGLSMSQSDVHDNAVLDYGFTNADGSAIRSPDGSSLGNISIVDSSIHNNLAVSNIGLNAAALGFRYIPVQISNSTISDNTGIGLTNYYSSVSLNHVTITGNGYTGYVLYNAGSTLFESTLRNSIIAGNDHADCSFSTSLSYNHTYTLDGDDTCLLGSGPGNLPGEDPRLATLSPSRYRALPVHSLRAGSPAIDSGDPQMAGSGGTCLAEDEDGVWRPLDGDGGGARCDMGAMEYIDLIFADGFEPSPG